ncbi:MAG: BatA domain-containing protein [Fimbriimonadales bacterium]
MLSLLNAGLLPWMIAASVPVLIHLLTRRSRRRVVLPTVRFLQKTIASQSRLWRWRHLLTLVLRTLIVLALVFAFIKPSWLSAFAAQRGKRVGEVILLDVSESMSYNSGGLTTLAKAKSQARAALQGLSEGDRANVVFCGAQPSPALDAPTEDIALIRNAVDQAPATEERGDSSAAVNLAVEQLGKMNTEIKRLYVISDFKRTTWSDVHFETVPADTNILFVSVDPETRENVGLTSIRTRPSTPRIGETVTVQAEVFNSTPAPRTVPVEFQFSDGRHFSDRTTAGPYSSANASVAVSFDKPERVEITASLPKDNLPADDVRRTVVDLQQMARIVLLTDEDPESPTTAAFYLARALHPDPAASTGFLVIPVRPAALNNPVLKSADAVVVCNTPSMPGVQTEALARYVANGGNVIWFLYGDRVSQELEGFGKHVPNGEPIPFHLQSQADLANQAKGYVELAEARFESPLLKAFRDTSATALKHVRFTRFWITSEVDPRGELLLKYEDGTAAAVRTGEGSGNLLLLNMSPAPGWSDLARQDVFVPLIHELTKGIIQKDAAQREANPGGPAAATIPPTKASLVCLAPNGDSLPVTQDKATGSVVVEKTRGSGFYHLMAGADPVATLAVNPHPDESDLRSIDPRELESKRQRDLSYLAGASGGATVADLQKGRELWPYLLSLALLCLIAEQAIRRVGLRPAKGGAR